MLQARHVAAGALAAALAVSGAVRADEPPPAPPVPPPPAPPAAQVELAPSFRLPQEAGREVSHMPGVVFTKDGARLIAGTSQGEVIAWETARGEIAQRVKFADSPVLALAMDPEGTVLVALLESGALEVVDPKTGKVVAAEEKVEAARTLVIAPDGKHIAIARKTAIEVRSVPSLTVVGAVAAAHATEVTNLAASPDGKLLASVGRDGKLRLWSLPGLAPGEKKSEKASPLHAVAFSPDGAKVAFGGEANIVHEMDVATGHERTIAEGQPYWITAVGYSRDGKTLAIGDESCDIWLYDVEARKRLFHGKHHVECWLSSVAWAPDQETFLFGCRPNSHAGKPAIYTANVHAEALGDESVQRLAGERRRIEAQCWEIWVEDGNRETRDKVRGVLAKRVEARGERADEKKLDALERQWLTGGPIPEAATQTVAPAAGTSYGYGSGGTGLGFDLPSGGPLDGLAEVPIAGEPPPAPAPALAPGEQLAQVEAEAARKAEEQRLAGETTAAAAESRKRAEALAPLDQELAELKKQAASQAAVAEGLAKAEAARKAYQETLAKRVQELQSSFLLNRWKLKKN